MRVISKKGILNFSLDVFSMLSLFTATSCIILKSAHTKPICTPEDFDVFAVKTIFSRGSAGLDIFKPFLNSKVAEDSLSSPETPKEESNISPKNEDNKIEAKENSQIQNIQLDNSGVKLPEIPEGEEDSHAENEKKCRVIEKHISGGTKCENFYVKNTTGQDVDLNGYLKKEPAIEIKETSEPQVLIMHTHTSESYLQKDTGYFYENFYPRSLENGKNVTAVGEMITQVLKNHGINTIHSMVYHDNPSYNGSYCRAAQTIKETTEKYPSIQMVIDIHRDSMGNKELGKVKPTFTYDGKKSSQLMIICGCDPDGSVGFPNWEKNLSLGLRLQKYCETFFPGITRPLNFSKVKYNEHLTPGSLLIEVGSDVNTLKESLHTGFMLGTSLSKMLNDLKK